MSAADDELIAEFLVEAREHVDGLDVDLVALERDPADSELLARVFRRVHTVKGAAGFLGFATLEAISHAGEDLLALLRDRALVIDRHIADGLLALADAMRELLGRVEATGDDGEGYSQLIKRLHELQEPGPEVPAEADAERLGDILIQQGAVRPEEIEQALGVQDRRSLSRADTTIRVDTTAVDRLMNLTSELVLARNALVAVADVASDPALAAAVQRMGRVATRLQSAVNDTRMHPIGGLWQKLPRVVRDLATASGKQVRLVLAGADIELDKAVLEAIKDPLTHLVRNAVDHGIELPDVRVAAGKPAEGLLSLRAFHEHGRVNIEVRDDGGGIDLQRLAATFRRRFPDRELPDDRAALLDLVFTPGFSTVEQVTNLSGRGVGMDVVRTRIERIGGTIELATAEALGMTITMRVPLTTAIMPALLICAADQRYAVPQVHVGEVIVVAPQAVEYVHDAPVVRHRGQLLPLVQLADLLGLPEAADAGPLTLVIVEADVRFALAVTAVRESSEIVVKPLADDIRRLGVFAAATVLDDGRPALILDLAGVAKRAGIVAVPGGDMQPPGPPARSADETAFALLLVDVAGRGRCGLRLDEITRLERMPTAAVQHASGRAAVHYRGRVLPLLHLGSSSDAVLPPDAVLTVVIIEHDRVSVGLVIDQLVGIVADAAIVGSGSSQVAVTDTALVGDQLIDVLDVGVLATAVAA